MNRTEAATAFRAILRSPGTEDECVAEALAVADEYAAWLAERIARPPAAASLLDNPVVRVGGLSRVLSVLESEQP